MRGQHGAHRHTASLLRNAHHMTMLVCSSTSDSVPQHMHGRFGSAPLRAGQKPLAGARDRQGWHDGWLFSLPTSKASGSWESYQLRISSCGVETRLVPWTHLHSAGLGRGEEILKLIRVHLWVRFRVVCRPVYGHKQRKSSRTGYTPYR